MKILIRNSDSVVIYAQNDLILDTEAHGNNWRDPKFNSSNATLVDATLPRLWTGAAWSYINGVWAVVDSARYAELLDVEKTRIRELRNNLLKTFDWTQIIDSTADKAAWATYRQALRDITTQAGFPWTVEWPVQP